MVATKHWTFWLSKTQIKYPKLNTYAVKLDLASGPVRRLPADVDEVHSGDVVVSTLDGRLRRRTRETVFCGAWWKKIGHIQGI